MKIALEILAIIVGAFAACFAIWWVFNFPLDTHTTIRFRDWWRNRPTWRNPDRWERYKRHRD